MIYIVQDTEEDDMIYIASYTTEEAALMAVSELEAQDIEDRTYRPGRYKVSRHGICYSNYARKCGHCTNSICMLKNPDIDCPKIKKRAAAQAAGEGSKEILRSAT